MRMNSVIAVIAGSREQFEYWAKENPDKSGARRHPGRYANAIYAHTPELLHGLAVSEIVHYGTYYRLNRLREIERELRHCQIASEAVCG